MVCRVIYPMLGMTNDMILLRCMKMTTRDLFVDYGGNPTISTVNREGQARSLVNPV